MILECRGKKIELGKKTKIMGILNLTQDSFSDGGKYNNIDRAFSHAKRLMEEGADILDIGGESTRPGHTQISDDEEIERIFPIIEKISKELEIFISIDTYKYKVAKEALEAGAHIINDIWGLQYDNGEMAELAAHYKSPVIVMHNKKNTDYDEDIMISIKKFFHKSYEISSRYNIPQEKIILDPGIGFGKNGKQNIEVIGRLEELNTMGRLLLGTSKKRFIGEILGDLLPDERVEGTIATTIIGISKGVDIVRVHNVLENKRAAMVADAVYREK